MRSLTVMFIVLISAASAAWAADPAKVLFVPFSEADASQQPDWVTRAINQSAVDELSSMPNVTVTTPPGSGLNPAAAAPAAAAPTTQPQAQPSTRPASDYTVRGTIQRVNQQIRVSGNVSDASGKTVGGFKATGTEQDLFAIEDSVAEQLRSTLGIAEQPASLAPPSSGVAGAKSQVPVQPLGSSYDGSDLERSVYDPTYTRRLSDRSYWNNATTPAGIVMPGGYGGYGYPPGYGYNYPPYYVGGWGWGGWGWGWGWGGTNNVVIINQDNKRHHDGRRDHGSGTMTGVTTGPRISTNGQAIRAAATGTGGLIMQQPQLVPSGGPQLVPSGGPQLVPGNPVPPGLSGASSSAPKGAGVNMGGSHAPGAGFTTGGSNAPGAGHR
jgi:TolB-like protein